jgi:hypothetical protein
MQRQLGLAVFSIAALYLSACSEGDPDPRRFRPTDVTGAAGGGGSVNSGGSGGAASGGTGGGVSSGGSNAGGQAGSAGAGSMPLSPPGCTGCLEMDVVLDPAYRDPTDSMPRLIAMYNFQFATDVDMSNATVTWSLATLTPNADVYVTPFAQNGAMPNNYAGVYRPQTPLSAANGFTASSSAFVDVVLDLANTAPLGAAPAPAAGDAGAGDAAAGSGLLDNGGMDKSAIFQLGLQVGALSTLAAPTTVRLLLDKVTFTGVDATNTVVRNRDFSDGPQEFMVNSYNLPPGSTGPTKY